MKWNLTYLFKTPEDFQKELESLGQYVGRLGEFQGKLGDEQTFKSFNLLNLEVKTKLMRVYQYAHLKSDLNKKDVENDANVMRCMMLLNQFSVAMAFVEPEILAVGKDKILGFVDKNPELAQFRFGYEKIFRAADHYLDEKSEKLLAIYGPTQTAGELYSNLSTADGKAVEVTLSDGSTVSVTQGSWRGLIAEVETAEDRKLVFEAIFNYYELHKNTFAGIYNAVLQSDKANYKARNFNSILESYLFRNNIPVEVYKNLVKVAGENNEALKKYLSIRKEVLGLEDINTYDRFLELAKSDKKYSYEEACSLFFSAINKFPKEFIENAHKALEEGFVDVYEQDGKRSGAYSSGMENLRPFILLNFNKTLDDVFTVAHEAGHSIHSLYAQAQPSELQDYTIFVAEIASTFNEHVLLDYFIDSGKATKEEKIMLLQKAIDEIIGTFYRQTLFAEYELIAHELVEKDEPINYQVLSKIMTDLYAKYYGIDLAKEKVKEYVWAYIPHLFYTPFYVYQYATSFAASFKIYKDVRNNVDGAFTRYINLLKSGGSKYPIEQAKDAGVDFLKPETFLAVVERMTELVNELEAVIKG